MTPERWERIKELFGRIELVTEEDQQAELRRACDGDEVLYDEVASLLWPATNGQTLLEHPLVSPEPDEAELVEGQMVDGFKVVTKLGQGGMGAVYLAERLQAPSTLRVAIKVLKGEILSNVHRHRFIKETQILAYLNHAHIAKFFRGGVLDDGRPFFLMEYIEGIPIHEYCHQHSLTLDQRISLVRKVCDAVQYAHQNLVIHRDIKPSNILVTPNGVPKLLDFGVAKIIKPEASDLAETATVDFRPMTPRYASPEQLRGAPTTTATDVFSLAVLLHELLVGFRPFEEAQTTDPEGKSQSTTGASQRPSRLVHRRYLARGRGRDVTTQSNVDHLDELGMSAKRLRASLQGDLDRILMHALQQDPLRRYASVQQFAEDLGRYQQGYPVSVTSESKFYLLGRFMVRNKIAVGTLAGVFALLIGFTQVLVLKNQEITRERDHAQRISAFLKDVFKNADPYVAQGKDVTARILLDQARRQIGEELSEEPVTRADLLATMGGTYQMIGYFSRSEELYQEALDLQLKHLGEHHVKTATTKAGFAKLSYDQRKLEKAKTLFLEALAVYEKRRSAYQLEIAQILAEMGRMYTMTGEYDKADDSLERSMRITRNRNAKEFVRLLGDAYDHRGHLAKTQSKYEQAESLYLRSLEIKKQTGMKQGDLAPTQNNLAVLYSTMERFDQAEIYLEKAHGTTLTSFGQYHLKTMIAANNLATFYLRKKQYDKAETLLREQAEYVRGWGGGFNFTIFNNLGSCLLNQNRLEEAQAAYEEALTALETIENAPISKRLACTVNLAVLHRKQGQFDKATVYFGKAEAMAESELGPDHHHLARLLLFRGNNQREQNHIGRAENFYTRALTIYEKALNPRHSERVRCLERLASLYQEQGAIDQLRALAEKWPPLREANKDTDNPRMEDSLAKLEKIFGAPAIAGSVSTRAAR